MRVSPQVCMRVSPLLLHTNFSRHCLVHLTLVSHPLLQRRNISRKWEIAFICKFVSIAQFADAVALTSVNSNSMFAPGTGPILLADVGCTGNETNLFSCPHNLYDIDNCHHYDDVGVICPQGV